MRCAAKREGGWSTGFSSLWLVMLLAVLACLAQTRVWGFSSVARHESGVFATSAPTAVGETTTIIPYDAPDCLLAAKGGGVVYRELSVADRLALEAGQPLVPKGTGGTILDHVRGQPTGHISVSETIEGTSRFAGGNGLAEINIEAATSGGSRLIPHPEVIQGVGDRAKQIQKVLESKEALIQGPIPPEAVRIIPRR